MIRKTLITLLKSISPKYYSYVKSYHCLIRAKDSYLHSTGWIECIREGKPIDLEGEPIPWMNYSVIRILEDKLNDSIEMFEFGSGYSTFFYANKVKSVTSVEYDESWFKYIRMQLPTNAKLLFTNNDIDGCYCRTITAEGKKFDLVVIDGRDRVNCIKQSILCLSSTGVILLDDSNREKYNEGIDFAKSNGFKFLHIEGLKPSGSRLDRTTIFYREKNCLGI